MDTIYTHCVGLDIHRSSVSACVMVGERKIEKHIRQFGTFTDHLLDLKTWLLSYGVTHVAMESTGIYWKPIFNILEDKFEILLANARHIKNVPGRKTDINDCEWICKLMRNGLLDGSFIPPVKIRDLRDMTGYRRKLVQNVAMEKNRIIKVLEDANIKLSSVASNIFGVSGSSMLEAMQSGETSEEVLAEFAKGRLKSKKADLKLALKGHVREHHKKLISFSLDHIRHLGEKIESVDKEVDLLLSDYQDDYERLQTIPGVKEDTAASIIAGIGTDMSQFKDEHHLSSWAGMSPGNNESAGKKKAVKPHMATRI